MSERQGHRRHVHQTAERALLGDAPWDAAGVRKPDVVIYQPRPLPVLDHEHEWVDTTVLEDDQRVDICAAGGCSATRTVPR